jgi:hypothetical protein
MRHRSRRTAHRDQSGRLKARLFSMVAMLFVIGLLYSQARQAKNWKWLAPSRDEPEAMVQAAANVPGEPAKETVLEGPTDLDADQQAEATKLLAAITDRQKLSDVEMPAYWRLLGWAQRQSFDDLNGRAQRDVALTKLHEQPDLYRGKPIRLKLNVRRMLDWDAPENSSGIKHVYEAWGWTDDSKARPYTVVAAELPEGLKPGTDVSYDVVFVGYFLKWLQYETFQGKKQFAPLLLGRFRPIPAAAAPAPSAWSVWDYVFLAGGIGIIAFGLRAALRRNPPPRRLLAAEADAESAMEFFKAGGESQVEKPDRQSSDGAHLLN